MCSSHDGPPLDISPVMQPHGLNRTHEVNMQEYMHSHYHFRLTCQARLRGLLNIIKLY